MYDDNNEYIKQAIEYLIPKNQNVQKSMQKSNANVITNERETNQVDQNSQDMKESSSSSSRQNDWSKRSEIILIDNENKSQKSDSKSIYNRKQDTSYLKHQILSKLSTEYSNLIKEFRSDLIYIFVVKMSKKEILELVYENGEFCVFSTLFHNQTQDTSTSKKKKYLREMTKESKRAFESNKNASKIFIVCSSDFDNLFMRLFLNEKVLDQK